MMQIRSRQSKNVVAAIVSLAFVYLFFLEYLPPLERVHLYSDIEGYHYPLLHYVFASLKQGHLPLWDPSIYCGMTLIGNIQAAVLYPPNWLMFAVNFKNQHLSYTSLQALVMLHIWGSFLFSFLWFRTKRLHPLAGILGAGVYAFGGYMLSQASHVGISTGMAWTPLAMWGIDQAVERRNWRPLWKVAVASALFFLAGYVPSWLVFLAMVAIYGLVRAGRNWRLLMAIAASLLISMLLIAVQLLPAIEASQMKNFEPHFGNGVQEPEFYLALFIPNYFDLQRGSGWGHPEGTYLYLGAAFLLALGWMLIRRNFKAHMPAWAMIAGCSFFLANVNASAWHWVEKSRILAQACHSWNFLEGVVLSAALITAVSLDDFLKRGSGRSLPRWMTLAAGAALLSWAARLFVVWLPGGSDFSGRWASAWDAAIMVALLTGGMLVFRGSGGSRRLVVAVVIVLAVGMEYKVFGTSRRFSAWDGAVDPQYGHAPFPGLENAVFEQFWAHHEYRMATDDQAETDTERFRHFRVTTPQGFDPLLPARYRQLIETFTPFKTDRTFSLKPQQEDLMRELSVRYYLTVKGLESYQFMLSSPDFRLLQPYEGRNYALFEYLRAEPPYGFDIGSKRSTSGVEMTEWRAARRSFRVVAGGGKFVLGEQYYPGWQARIDGKAAPIEPWHQAFQAIQVPSGDHDIVFEYSPPSFRLGAIISLLSLAGLISICIMAKRGRGLEMDKSTEASGGEDIWIKKRLASAISSGCLFLEKLDGRLAIENRKGWAVAFFLFLTGYFLYFARDCIGGRFAPDDMMNMAYTWRMAPLKLLAVQFMPWLGFYRPLSGLIHVPLIDVFGLNPLPFHIAASVILLVNCFLSYRLARLLGCPRVVSGMAAMLVAFHPGLANLYYNTAFIYDILCYSFYIAALAYYVKYRKSGTESFTWRRLGIFLVLYLCALNAKEMAATLPLVLVAYELCLGPRAGWTWQAFAGICRVPAIWLAGILDGISVYGKVMVPGAMIASSAYRPVLSLERLSKFQIGAISDLFCKWNFYDGYKITAVWVLVTYLAWRKRNSLLRFCWFFMLLAPLPIEFLEGRGQACLYIPLAGWAIFAAILLSDLSRSIAKYLQNHEILRRLGMRPCQALLLLFFMIPWFLRADDLHQRYVKAAISEMGPLTWETIQKLKELNPRVRPYSKVVFLHDPFDAWDMLFIAELYFRDRSISLHMQHFEKAPLQEVEKADCIIDYQNGRFVQLK